MATGEMKVPDNKQIFSDYIRHCWTTRDSGAAAALVHPDVAHYMPGEPAPSRGHDGYRALVDVFLAAFPDMVFTVDEVFGEGDRVCLLWTARGTHTGALNGIPPSKNKLDISGAGVAQVRDGKIERINSHFDTLTLLKQIGAFPG